MEEIWNWVSIGVAVAFISFIVYDYYDMKKFLRESEEVLQKHQIQYEKLKEEYEFLSSEEGERAHSEVQSICNLLGISLESDNDEYEEV